VTAVTEGLVELAAAKIGMDRLEIRRRNLIRDDAHPHRARRALSSGTLASCFARKARKMMDYRALHAEQAKCAKGICCSIGFAQFIEVTNPSAAGVGGAKISAQDGATVKLDATGAIFSHRRFRTRPGAEAVIAQCVATSFGVPIERVRVIMGDTDNTPYGGGTGPRARPASAAKPPGRRAGVRQNVLAVAGSILQAKPDALDINNGVVVDASTGTERIGLDESRDRLFPSRHAAARLQAELMATRHYVPRAWAFAFTEDPGELPRSRRLGLRETAQALVRRGLRHRDQPASLTSKSAAAWCRASAARCSSFAATTSAGKCSTATWRLSRAYGGRNA
jgi:carbon-monoxide dehydrogenase large subunit